MKNKIKNNTFDVTPRSLLRTQEVALILSRQLQLPQAPPLEVYNPPCSVGPIPKDKMVIKLVV